MNFVGDEYQKKRMLVKQAEGEDGTESIADEDEESGGESKDDEE
jgi:hypothetical protein